MLWSTRKRREEEVTGKYLLCTSCYVSSTFEYCRSIILLHEVSAATESLVLYQLRTVHKYRVGVYVL